MSAIKRDGAFNAFVSQAQAIMGADLSEDWLFEIWQGADADANRALNHVLDTPEEKIKRGGGGKQSRSEPKTPKKSSSRPRESKPAPPTPATTWDDDDYQAPPSPPPQQHHAPPPAQHPPQYQQPAPGMPQQPQSMPYPQPQPMPYPSMYPGMPQPTMPTMPMMPPQAPPTIPQFVVDPVTGMPMAPMNPIQQAQAMFVQQQQQQRLMMLKYSIDSVLSNPAMLTNPQIMQNLQDTMIQALEAPNATLQLAERARQSQQTAQFIQIMQGQVGQMLADPKVATNPALLQQLNNQMNQLRVLTMQHIAQQQLDANPATALSLSMPVLAPPTVSATLLSRAMLGSQSQLHAATAGASTNYDDPQDENRNENGDWWMEETKKSSTNLGEKNPFRDETETCGGTPKRSVSPRSRVSLSNPNLGGPTVGGSYGFNGFAGGINPAMMMGGLGSMGTMNPGGMMMGGGMPMGSGMMMPQSMPSLSAMYGANQAGYNPLLQFNPQLQQQQPQPFMSQPNMGPQMYRPM